MAFTVQFILARVHHRYMDGENHTRLPREDSQPISGRVFVGIIGFSLIGTGIFVLLLPLIPGVYVQPATGPQRAASFLWVYGLACFVVAILNFEPVVKNNTIEYLAKLSAKYLDR